MKLPTVRFSRLLSFSQQPPICIMHIGKTGGSYFNSILKANSPDPSRIKLVSHAYNIERIRKEFGANYRIAFTYREPFARFQSAFYSRLRQGRPTYQVPWKNPEATAFQWFATSNDLAEALGHDDERLRSAAYFSMQSISHLRNNYAFYLGSAAKIRAEWPHVVACINIDRLNDNLDAVMERLGLPDYITPEKPNHHKAATAPEPLSSLGKRSLRRYWKAEFRIYKTLEELSKTMFDAP